MQFKSKSKESISPHPGRPQPTERTFRAVKRSVEQNPRPTAADVAKVVEKNPTTVVRYVHALGVSELRACHLTIRELINLWGHKIK